MIGLRRDLAHQQSLYTDGSVSSMRIRRESTKDFSRQNLPGEKLWVPCLVPKVWRFGTPRPSQSRTLVRPPTSPPSQCRTVVVGSNLTYPYP